MNRVLTACILAASLAATSQAAQTDSTTSLLSKLQWRNIGPFIGGRAVAVTGVPSRPGVFYMAPVQGGVWRSTNYGTTWENLTDGKIPRAADSMGAIAVAQSDPNVIYAGSGESDLRQDFDTGEGIYKSADDGKTWHYSGLSDTHTTASLVVDPRNANIVYAATLGHVFKPNSERGVFKSIDGGKTWHSVLYVDDRTGANAISMDPHDPNVLYASMWQVGRTPWALTSGGPGSGLYKTADGGAHWTKISTHPGFARGPLGKIGVSVSGADPRVVYAIVQAHDGGVFRSADGGATWDRMNAEWKLRQRAFYYMAIFADPANPNVAYAPQVDGIFKTADGGKTWKPILVFGDEHIVWIDPRNPKTVIAGDDGGASVTVDGGKTWSTEHNQPTGQYYHITLDDEFPFHVYGAAQDEGAFEGPSASHEGLTDAGWHQVAWGESTFVAPQPSDLNVTYGSGYFTFLSRFDMSTGENKNVSPWPKYISGMPASAMKYRFGWSHPIFFSPADPRELFVAAQVVLKSGDYGATWSAVSPDLTRNDKRVQGSSGGPVDLDQVGTETYPFISSLAVFPHDANVMWAGSSDGLVHLTTDAGATWRSVTPPDLPQWAEITSIQPSTADGATAYVSASRYMWDDFHPYVFKTADFGAHWTKIVTGLPDDQYVFTVRQDPREPRVLFAGTRSGVYVSLNGGGSWQSLALNLPGVQVRDIAIDARQGSVAIATHGRAFWILDNLALIEQLLSEAHPIASAPALFAPETAWLTHAYGHSSSDPNTGQNPAYGATVFFQIPAGYDGKTPVTLSFADAQGRPVRRFQLHLRAKHESKPEADVLATMDHARQLAYALRDLTAVDPGMNAFTWDLRHEPATEIAGYHIPTADDVDDGVNGPTILPGNYTAVLDYGGTQLRRTFSVKLDPRLNPGADALPARLALATSIRDTLDSLDRAVNAAFARRPHLSREKQAQMDRILRSVVEMRIQSSEGDSLHQVQLRDYLGFLMNELDMAYQAPTAAEVTTFGELRSQASNAIAALDRIR